MTAMNTATILTLVLCIISFLFQCSQVRFHHRSKHRYLHGQAPSYSPSQPPISQPYRLPFTHFPSRAPSYNSPSPPHRTSPHHSRRHHPSRSEPYHSPPQPPSGTPTYSQRRRPGPAPSPRSVECSRNSTQAPCIFDVRSFGAVGDSVSNDTEAFKLAWQAACHRESAVIHVPSDHTFMIQPTMFSGPCEEGLVFQVDGILSPPDVPDSWPERSSKRQWLVFYRVYGMTLQGQGVIDGRGEKWWNLLCKPHRGPNGTTLPGPCNSPIAIRFFESSNLTVKGLKMMNSPQFHFRFDSCTSVRIDSISITAPALSPNTDGIHVENTQSVGIYNSIIANDTKTRFKLPNLNTIKTPVGDDCVSIGAGCINVDIRNVTCGPSHGISIGSLGNHNSHACVSNISVSEVVMKHSDNGPRIKTWQGGSGSVSAVTFKNVFMDRVRNPIIIDQYYCLGKRCSNQSSAVLVSDISYRNIKGTYDIRSPPMRFACSNSSPCYNLTLSDIELLPAEGELVHDPFCWNAYGEAQTLTIPPVSCFQEGVPVRIIDSSTEGC